MTAEDFRITMFAIFQLSRWQDNGDGTATDVWHREAVKAFRTAETDAASKMREDAAVVADGSDARIAGDIRRIAWKAS